MKIYIIGCVGSGKSTLARKISDKTGVPFYGLDQLVHIGNKKRTEEERDRLFWEILQRENYIVEDVGRACFRQALQEVDRIVFLNLPKFTTRKRVLIRFIKQKLGIEKATYRPTLQMLKLLLIDWHKSPEDKLVGFSNIIRLSSKKEVSEFLENLKF